jgi:hypothetical protein
MMTNTAPDWLTLARDAYTASTSYFDASIRQQIEADLRQSQGQHPVGSKYLADKSRSRLFRPKTRATIRKNEAVAAEAFFATQDVVQIAAENDNDPLQQASAAVMAELLQYRLTKSIPWFLTLVGAYQDAQTVGVVASYQYWEYNEKKKLDRPQVRLIPIENLRFDPGASWTDPVGTSPYLIELIPMYLGEVKARMNTPDPKTGEAKWKTLPDAVILSATKGYGDTIRMQREGQRMDSKSQQQANNAFNIVWVHKNIVSMDDADYVYYTLGCEHLLSEPLPLEQRYFHGKRPYVIGSCVIETHKTYPSSVPRLTRDVQAEINEVANQRIDNVKLAMNKRYFARRNKQVDIRSVTRNVPGSVTLMQDVDDVKVVEFNDVTGSSYKEQEVLNLDFDDMAGAFSGASVQSNRKLNETVGGMKLLDTNANQVSSYQLRTFVETWVEPVLRQIVLLEQFYETDETLVGLCGEAAQLAQKFGVDQVTDDMLMQEFSLNVNVGMGATNPTDQVKQFISGMTALRDMLSDGSLMRLGLKVEEVIKELFGKLGYKDGSRFFDMQNEDPQLKQMQATIDQLQQALDAKMDPKIIDATVRKIDAEIASMGVKDKVQNANAVKQGTEAQFSAMQTAEVIAAVPAVAPIADVLMKAAGYTPPTPPGVDPNFPQPGLPDANLGIKEVTNKRTGMVFTPGDGSAPPLPPPSTTLRPAGPATPGIGERHGIETTRPDSIAQAAYADGGLIEQMVGYDGLTDQQRQHLQYAAMASEQRAARPAQPVIHPTQFNSQGDYINTLQRGGEFTNAEGEPDNLASYNLAPLGLAPNALNNSPLHDAMAYSQTRDLLSESAFNNGRLADGGLIGDALNSYDDWSQNHPAAKLALDVLPVTNVVTSALDVANDLHKGEYWTAAGDALGLIPGFKLAKTAAMPSKIAQVAALASQYRRPIDAAVNAVPEYISKLQPQQHQLTLPSSPTEPPAYASYANGGLIAGPGSGTSDSIAAQANGQPLAVSNGEYHIPAAVVAALGRDFFDKLVAQFHQPSDGAQGPLPSSAQPLGMAQGDFIVPADVVAALGADFFDRLVQLYGGAQ